jgi:hypothetical protein
MSSSLWRNFRKIRILRALVGSFVQDNVQLGYATKEEFIQDAIRFRLDLLSEEKHLGARVKGRRSE